MMIASALFFAPASAVVAAPAAAQAAWPASFASDQRSREIAELQVLLDRTGNSPGVIDGLAGANTSRALRAYQRENGLAETGEMSSGLLETLRAKVGEGLFVTYTLTRDDVDGPFVDVPAGMAAQASLQTLAYERPAEGIAEKFHMAESFLQALNPGADFRVAGTTILVAAPRPSDLSAKVERIEVDKTASEVRAYNADGQIVATYPATVGSSTFPSPSGSMEVLAVAPAPTYHFDPEGRSWGPDHSLTIAAGPNNPVGGTWIDLSKEGYGIHGTPDPALIGKTASHGCVRLTNWDAEELADAVEAGTRVIFT